MPVEYFRAPRGLQLTCANWQIEAAYRMVQNNLDADVAEDPENLIVYGGLGKAARNHEALHKILATLRRLQPDETMLVQSGKCVGVMKLHEDAPRVLLANSNLVGDWATWDEFRRLDALGLMMYGQMTAGSWIYIGSQGIVQGTYETFVAAGKKHFGSDLRGRLVVTSGLGGMGSAQPLAVTMAGGVCLCADVERKRIEKRVKTRYLDEIIDDPKLALKVALDKKAKGIAWSIGVPCNATELLTVVRDSGAVPDMVTDQTSAHDMLVGYVPDQMTVLQANELRARDPKAYQRESARTVAKHVALMLDLQERGAITFDYGNNIRTEARAAGVGEAFRIKGFIPEYIRPLFCEGRGPFRWVALSGDPSDIACTDALALKMFGDNVSLRTWIEKAQQRIAFQGLPARILWLGYGERARFGLAVNELVRSGELKAPIVFGRDHLDCGSVASPYRETEAMLDGSDAIADWPLLNAMANVAAGATWVSIHHGGGVGMGKSIHAGQVTVADGSSNAARRIQRVFTCDPGSGILRHADAGYPAAKSFASTNGVDLGG
ncbi:MAG: urocanate hydratase [Planctomycetota bacterium]|jgi:urocanate hydratase|nr:urocanate hydratase [Planctomycetota bacterium]MSR38824.1 urocanate hydratase [Planctomycetota bacterium]